MHSFSYNYGQAIGAATWMHYVTKEQTWLDQAATCVSLLYIGNCTAQSGTASSNAVLASSSRPTASWSSARRQACAGETPRTSKCVRPSCCGALEVDDAQAIYLRNLAYLFRETQDQSVKDSIGRVIDTSVNSMVSRSCTADWFCKCVFRAATLIDRG